MTGQLDKESWIALSGNREEGIEMWKENKQMVEDQIRATRGSSE
jgi:hypothetical protein